MRRRPALRALALSGLLVLPLPEHLAACAFHVTLPETTVTERLAAGFEVVAARPAADDPFRFEVVEVLRGTPSGTRPPHLVDSATRARLSRHPEDAVLFVRDADGTWTKLLDLDAGTRFVADRMVARAALWTTAEGAAERRDLFAALLASGDGRVARLALQELDALPYAILRRGAYPVAAADLLRDIADVQEMPFAPVRILLLGTTGEAEARAAIMARLASMAATGGDAHLGAWITAGIESGGADGAAEIGRLFLAQPGTLTSAQLPEVVRALAVQSAEGDTALRAAIDDTVRRLIALRPEAAPMVAQAFGANADYSQTDLIGRLVAARAFASRQDLMAAAAYVTRARAGGPMGSARPGQAPASP